MREDILVILRRGDIDLLDDAADEIENLRSVLESIEELEQEEFDLALSLKLLVPIDADEFAWAWSPAITGPKLVLIP